MRGQDHGGAGPRTACVTMVRDEADILPAFLAHAAALFDLVLVAEHRSADATPSILAAAIARGWPVHAWRMEQPGHWHAAATDALARAAFARGADWVFPLDADEFLDVADAAALRARLAGWGRPTAFLRWRHAVPEAAVLEGEAPAAWPTPRWRANPRPATGDKGKVALHRSVAERLPGFGFSPGNHTLVPMPFAKPLRAPTLCGLWHLPVRGRAQFLGKLRRDAGSHTGADGHPISGMEDAAPIKARLLHRLEAERAGTEALQRIALSYWELGEDCLDPHRDWPAPEAVAPTLAMRLPLPLPLPRPSALAATPPGAAAALPLGTRLAAGRIEGDLLRIVPAPAGRQRLARIDDWLQRRLTPGLRLARFLAGWRVRRRLRGAVRD